MVTIIKAQSMRPQLYGPSHKVSPKMSHLMVVILKAKAERHYQMVTIKVALPYGLG